MNSLDYEIFTGVNVLINCCNFTCTNLINRCMITLRKRSICINICNDEPQGQPLYGLSVDFRYQIYGSFFSSNYRLRIPSWASLFEALGG